MSTRSDSTPEATAARTGRTRPRVVILGGGYGGIYTALKLQKAAKRGEIDLSLISRNNFFLLYPMLAEAVSGSIEPPHIVNPIRRLCRYCDFHLAEIEAIDFENRNVIIHYPDQTYYRSIPYDHLVISVGSSTDLSRIPGMSDHSYPFKTLGDAVGLRNHLISLLERAEVEDDPVKKQRQMTFVVAGGGYTGVEVAAEINDFIREAAKSYRHIEPDEANVILLQGGSRILPELSEGLADFDHRLLERRGIDVRLNTRVAGATAEYAILMDGSSIPTRTLVATIGSAPNRLLDKLPCSRDSRGRLVVDETLSVPELEGVCAVGDCAAIPDLNSGGTCPPTAQFAVREARWLARNILAEIKGKEPKPFRYRSLGTFVPMGRYSGVAEFLGLKLRGFLAWWLYRTYYLLQTPSLDRKVRLLKDWNQELLLRRDIIYQDLSRSERASRAHYESGQTIFNQGELAQRFYIIISGEVQVCRQLGEEEQVVATLGPGEYFGEIALLQGVRHTASVRALSPVDLLTIDGADFTALATSSTHFGELLAGVMRQRQGGTAASPGAQPVDRE